MKKNVIRNIIFIALVFVIFFLSTNIVNAHDFNPEMYGPGLSGFGKIDADSLFKMGEKLFGVLRNIATIIAIITMALTGLKFVFGSAEAKAEYKKTMLPWFVGAVFVVMLTTFLGIIEKFAKNIGV